MADFESELKIAWEAMTCPRRLVARPPNRIVAQPHCGPGKGHCKGHTAHLSVCDCNWVGNIDQDCVIERRRLRAAVGVDK